MEILPDKIISLAQWKVPPWRHQNNLFLNWSYIRTFNYPSGNKIKLLIQNDFIRISSRLSACSQTCIRPVKFSIFPINFQAELWTLKTCLHRMRWNLISNFGVPHPTMTYDYNFPAAVPNNVRFQINRKQNEPQPVLNGGHEKCIFCRVSSRWIRPKRPSIHSNSPSLHDTSRLVHVHNRSYLPNGDCQVHFQSPTIM